MEIQDLSVHGDNQYLKAEPKLENTDYPPTNTYHNQLPQNLSLDGRLSSLPPNHYNQDSIDQRHYGLNGTRLDDGRYDPRLRNPRDSSGIFCCCCEAKL
ncbi:hypothetical protein QYM36_003882 [Artemia franciscana]|uniref:Uncharacterized protein n=1 Tax=Artemia franciscana TaxID=6661 RepID=A0AA88I5B2_ARTSF|nr:hypothetical protein QYM36_003882 [Artemia franciscana]